jgi:hypothetical protein
MKLLSWLLIILLSLTPIACQRHSNQLPVANQSQSRDSLLLELCKGGLIGKDSLLQVLYNEGHITKEKYYHSRLKADVVKEGLGILVKLRSRLKYKFPVDYLIQPSDSEKLFDLALYGEQVKKIHPQDTQVLEEFILSSRHQLLRCRSFDNSSNHYLLATFVPGFHRFDLFSADSDFSAFLDKIELPREGIFHFDTLNGGNVIKFEYHTWGSGYFTKHLSIVCIANGGFKYLFQTTLVNLLSQPWTVQDTRTISTIKFVDLNRDGLLDILQVDTVDVVRDVPDNLFNEGALETSKSVRIIKTETKRYIWNRETYAFIEQRWKES